MSLGFDAIPDELIIELWRFCLYPRLLGMQHLTLTSLRLVCRRWDTLALSTNDLWSSIHYETRSRVIAPVWVVKLWLERSHNAPLTISLIGTYATGPEHADFVEAAYMLSEHLSRWGALRTTLEFPAHRAWFHTLPLSKATLLRHLDLTLTGPGDKPPKSLSQIPDLRTFSFHRPNPLTSLLRVVSSTWTSRLLEIRIEGSQISTKAMLDFIRMCTSSRKITISTFQRRSALVEPEHYNSPLISLQNLRLLDVTLGRDTYQSIQYLRLPSLLVFEFTKGWKGPGLDLSTISDFVKLSAPNLLALKINNREYDDITYVLSLLSQAQVTRLPVVSASPFRHEDFVRVTTRTDRSMDSPRALSHLKHTSRYSFNPPAYSPGMIGWANGDVIERLLQDFPDDGISNVRRLL